MQQSSFFPAIAPAAAISDARTGEQRERVYPPTPRKAARKTCLNCASTSDQVKSCEVAACSLHPLRSGRGGGGVLKPIRKHCLYCMGESFALVRDCPDKGCPSWPFRFGHRPKGE